MNIKNLKNKNFMKLFAIGGFVSTVVGMMFILLMTTTPYSFAQSSSSLGGISNDMMGNNNNGTDAINRNNHSNFKDNPGESLVAKETPPNREMPLFNNTGAQNAHPLNLADTTTTTNNVTNLTSSQINQNVSLSSYSQFVNDVNSLLLASEASKNAAHASDDISSGANSTSVNSDGVSETNSVRSKLLSLHEVVLQNTSMSAPAPVRHPGQPPHEVVFALPLRNDGKIWTGTVTFTASKPIEVEVLHTYSPTVTPDSTHRAPYNAVLPGNNSIAITHLRHLVDVPFEINGTGISSGSLDFVGNALLFHKTTGEPFTVTYTLDAVAKKLTSLK